MLELIIKKSGINLDSVLCWQILIGNFETLIINKVELK